MRNNDSPGRLRPQQRFKRARFLIPILRRDSSVAPLSTVSTQIGLFTLPNRSHPEIVAHSARDYGKWIGNQGKVQAMTTRRLFLLALLLALALPALVVISNPLRRSEGHIKDRLLAATPWGTSMGEVENYVRDQGWEIAYVSMNYGFLDQRVSPAIETGKKSIRVELGDYQSIPFRAYVTVFWGFNEQSELTDIWVWKTLDAL